MFLFNFELPESLVMFMQLSGKVRKKNQMHELIIVQIETWILNLPLKEKP